MGVASGGKLLGLTDPPPPETDVGTLSFLTEVLRTESIDSRPDELTLLVLPFDVFRLFSKLENQLFCFCVNSLIFGLIELEGFRFSLLSSLVPFSISF